MNTSIFDLKGNEHSKIDLPEIFNFPYRPEIIKKVYVNMDSHHYQEQGRYPAAGEIVSAESRNTGLGIARLARAKGEGFSRAGQAAGVGGVRKGRLAHPPESWKVIYKKMIGQVQKKRKIQQNRKKCHNYRRKSRFAFIKFKRFSTGYKYKIY